MEREEPHMSAHVHTRDFRSLIAVARPKPRRASATRQDWGDLTVGRVSSLLAIMVLLFWPIASCGSIDMTGSDVLRFGGPLSGPFSDDDVVRPRCLRPLYAGTVACAVAGTLFCESVLVSLVAGGGGVVLFVSFLVRLVQWPGIEIRYGAHVAFLCFAGLLVHAALMARVRRRPQPRLAALLPS
jgi:hypothetical protein